MEQIRGSCGTRAGGGGLARRPSADTPGPPPGSGAGSCHGHSWDDFLRIRTLEPALGFPGVGSLSLWRLGFAEGQRAGGNPEGRCPWGLAGCRGGCVCGSSEEAGALRGGDLLEGFVPRDGEVPGMGFFSP